MDTAGRTNEGGRSKIDRVREKYGLSGLDRELEARFTRREDRYSLRQLATYLDRRVLGSAMEEAGMNPLAGECENLYRLLTDEEVSEGMRVQARKRLEQEGVDVDAVLDDFVSYQTVNRHLKRLGVEHRADEEENDRRRKRPQRIYALQNRTAAVTQRTLEEARSAGDLFLGDVDVFVDITAACEDCGTHLPVRDLFERGGCRCRGSE